MPIRSLQSCLFDYEADVGEPVVVLPAINAHDRLALFNRAKVDALDALIDAELAEEVRLDAFDFRAVVVDEPPALGIIHSLDFLDLDCVHFEIVDLHLVT